MTPVVKKKIVSQLSYCPYPDLMMIHKPSHRKCEMCQSKAAKMIQDTEQLVFCPHYFLLRL